MEKTYHPVTGALLDFQLPRQFRDVHVRVRVFAFLRQRARGDESRVEALGAWLRVLGSGFRVQGFGFRVQGLGLRVEGLGFGVSGLGYRV